MIQEVIQKLILKLKGTGWDTKLNSFLISKDFEKIIETLYQKVSQGERFTPPLKSIFRCFTECPLNNLKVVIIGQDSYPQLNIADGIAFSCSNTMKPQPSLIKLFEALNNTVENLTEESFNPDLTRWANQGILLINRGLTCKLNEPGKHIDLWHPFIVYLIDMLSLTNSGLIFCLLGSKAQELESLISPSHYIIKASHPMSAFYNNEEWNCNDMFNKINTIIHNNNGESQIIKW